MLFANGGEKKVFLFYRGIWFVVIFIFFSFEMEKIINMGEGDTFNYSIRADYSILVLIKG